MGLFGFGKKKEQERQAEIERQREQERQAELERQREQERQAELEKQREQERQAELEKQRELERKKLAEMRENMGVMDISNQISMFNGIAIVNYKDMTIEQDSCLRDFLRSINVKYKVYRKNYFLKAIEDTDFVNLQEYVTEALAVALFEDMEQMGLLFFYCNIMEIGCFVEAVSYQKSLLLPANLEEIVKEQVQKVREKYADMMSEESKESAASTQMQIEAHSHYDQYFLELIALSEGEMNKLKNLNLYLTNPGDKFVHSVKLIYDITGLSLQESKELASKAKKSKVLIKSFSDKASLLSVKRRFEEIGAETEID